MKRHHTAIMILSMLLLSLLAVRVSPAFSSESRITVTAYNNGTGLIREVRNLTLTRGVMEYSFAGVAALIEPDSVEVRSLTHPGGFKMLEQAFKYDLTGTEQLLQRYLGQTILVTTREGDTFSGVLLDSKGGEVALRLEDRSIRVVKHQALETFQFPPLPGGLAEKPTLTFLLECKRSGGHDVELQYLTGGIRWSADYTARIGREGKGLEMSGQATVENRSGASYRDAQIRLLAGDVRRVSPPSIRRQRVFHAEAKSTAKASHDAMEESPVFEYHLYKLDRAVTLDDQQEKILPLLAPVQVKAERTFRYDGQRDGKKVRVYMEFKNNRAAGLGKPLPGGKVRVYKTDKDNAVTFVGEDAIKHTPEGEEVKLYLGSAFDLVGERAVKETSQVGKRSRQETIEIRLRNHKDTPVKVIVIEHFRGNWKFVSDKPPVVKKEADKVEFEVRVPRKGEKVFQYQVLYTW